jgi:hypothetical protein
MDVERNEQWGRAEISDTLVGRRPGASASEKARALRSAQPFVSRLARVLRVHTEERAWRKGANGERVTGWWLGRLPSGWFVFHDIPVGIHGANIDHLVIGPGGVFTINTKNLTGKLWVGAREIRHGGHRTDFLPKAAQEAERAAALLTAAAGRPVAVRGVLAIIVDTWTVAELPTDIYVGGPRGAKNWILRQPATLDGRAVHELAALAAKPKTWTTVVPERCGCGGHLIRRTRKADGRPFLGCTRFPTCRRTKALAV